MERGYDADWRRLRARHLRANPLCARCYAKGVVTVATLVDHVVPVWVAPARRLDPTNLQSLEARCHAEKTAEDARKYGPRRG